MDTAHNTLGQDEGNNIHAAYGDGSRKMTGSLIQVPMAACTLSLVGVFPEGLRKFGRLGGDHENAQRKQGGINNLPDDGNALASDPGGHQGRHEGEILGRKQSARLFRSGRWQLKQSAGERAAELLRGLHPFDRFGSNPAKSVLNGVGQGRCR